MMSPRQGLRIRTRIDLSLPIDGIFASNDQAGTTRQMNPFR